MGYNTEFSGCLEFNKPPSEELVNYINKFSSTRRMMRDPEKIKRIDPNWEKHCFHGELGQDGEYYIPADSFKAEDIDDFYIRNGSYKIGDIIKNIAGQLHDKSIIEYNFAPRRQPGLWCQWIIEDDTLVWDGGEKFYNYEEWLVYLIENFFEPESLILNGEIFFRGEDFEDVGKIVVKNNKVTIKYFE